MALDVLSTVQRSMEGRDIGIIAPFTPRSGFLIQKGMTMTATGHR